MKKLNWIMLVVLVNIVAFQTEAIAETEKEIYIQYEESTEKNNIDLQSVEKQNVETVSVPESEYQETIERLENSEEIKFVEEEIYYEYTSTPNDPLITKQKINFDKIGAYDAWETYQPGYTPVIAIIDSGLQVNHPDIKKSVIKPFNVVEQSTNVKDLVGHGTHVAGTAGATTNNRIGVASLVKNAKIMPIKVGEATNITNMNIARGIHYAIDNNADIINLSLGGPTPSVAIQEAISRANSKGVLVIAAAGNNSSSNKFYPAANKGVLSVSALDDKTNNIASYSNYGPWVDLTAPGTNTWSICTKGSLFPFTNCSSSSPYIQSSGTSMAAPMVSSMAGMLKSQNKDLSAQQIEHIFESASNINIGDTKKTKHGLVNSKSALKVYSDEQRLQGKTSVQTSNSIAKEGWSNMTENTLQPIAPELNSTLEKKNGKFAVLASNKSFADSLAASSLSSNIDAPLLLTFPDWLSKDTINTLKKLNITDVIILGGTSAVPNKIEDSIKNNGFNTIRFNGDNRYSTAVNINDYVAKENGEVIVVSGENFPDALAVSAFAARKKLPIVFVKKNSIPQSTKEFLEKYQFNKIHVIGGPNAIEEKVINELPNSVRIHGNTRYDTTIAVNNYFKETKSEGILVATGKNYPDALSGGLLAAKSNKSLILVDESFIPSSVNKYLEGYAYVDKKEQLQILGGELAIPSKTKWLIDKKIYQNYYDNRNTIN